jgi:phosphoribosylanthranilate isomerase
MTRVKICGITSTKDAKSACDAGADAIGLVFYPPSSRYVTKEQAAEIVASLPPFVTVVALFVNASKNDIADVLAHVSIDIIQFHGDEDESFCASFQRDYIKAIRMKDGLDLYALDKHYSSARALLLDTYKKGIPGGTGDVFNWDKVPHDLRLPIILAGGLVADNVAQAIGQVQPYAVDVSGGVEYSVDSEAKIAKKGKDQQKISHFMAQVR